MQAEIEKHVRNDRKILFMVAVGGILAQASKTTLKNNLHSSFVNHGPSRERGVNADRTEETQQLLPVTYLFSTSVSDPSRGFFQSRSEARSQNGQVKGEYSYMDEFYKVKVVYSAGPKGFRVIRQERIPLKKYKLSSKPASLNPDGHINAKLSN
ncbi:uncharacterized protein [Halyomorpha halys]|uniref:uncharacterized protein isoform X2 n=1 Tax=Halyomorpha halys TaxID=286706 RepID=UPI0006D50BED|nr:uncharacterized protein LOC106677351 isoform X2 [Halyomorpha halys]